MAVEVYGDRGDESGFSSRIESISGARCRAFGHGDAFHAQATAALVVQAHPFFPSNQGLEWARRIAPKAVSLITGGDKGRSWRNALKTQWKEWKSLHRMGIRVHRVVYKDGYSRWDLYRILGIYRLICGFDVHSQFLVDPQLYDAMFHSPWDPEKPRPVRISFLGCLDPKNRRGFLSSLKPLFRNADMYWHEYTDSTGAGVTAQEYLKLLSDSDFTLCPPGYSLVTHRPLEALLRGAIPIVNEGELCLYGIELKDKVNCISVKNHRWHDAVQYALNLSKEKVVSMRYLIWEMQDRLCYEKTSLSMCRRLGVL